MGTRRGFSMGFGGSVNSSSAWKRIGPLYQGMFVLGLTRFSPVQPDMGITLTFVMLYPTVFRRFETSSFASLNLASEYFTVWSSILLMQTTIWFTPRVFSRNACSLA